MIVYRDSKNDLLRNKRVYKINSETLLVEESAEFDNSGFCTYYKEQDGWFQITRNYDANGKEVYSTVGSTGKEYKMYDENGRLVETLEFDVFDGIKCGRGVHHTFYEYDENGNLIREYDVDKNIEYTYNGPRGMMDTKCYSYQGKQECHIKYSYEVLDDGRSYKRIGESTDGDLEIVIYDKNGNMIYYKSENEYGVQIDRYTYNDKGLLEYHKREGEFEIVTTYNDRGMIISEEMIYIEDGHSSIYTAEYNDDGLMIRDGYIGEPQYIYAYENMT